MRLMDSVITVEGDFGIIKVRERSASLSGIDIDERKMMHENKKITQLAGLSSTKKGVGINKN